jgi:class 3 adenylate cyclase
VLEAFLQATRAGMLDLYWDLLCPECRGVAEDHKVLGDINSTAHCKTCQIDFNANFDHNIEVIFRPNPSVRAVDTAVEFCVGSPQRQPHITFSLIVPPREELPLSTMLNEGRYTLRASETPGSQVLLATPNGAEKIDFRANAKGWPLGVTELGLMPTIRLINETDQAQTFELERTAWSDQAATAADVTTLQVFRDLFSSEVLRPGEEISVGSTTLMFTDLRNSTKLYREIGDAPAFGRVREHFEILEQAVAAEGGSIVKTMGDAIMAAFRHPASAMRAIWVVQKQLAQRGVPPLSIKVGIHQGPCIVVNLNDRLDYFGSTVNITARLPNFSMGGEVILSEPIRNDPEVVEFLEKNASPNSLTRFQAEIRGFDQSMDLWRIRI